MSNILYPLAGIETVTVTPYNSVVADDFEDGGGATRLYWPEKYFKRRFAIQHAPMPLAEFKALRGFYTERSGGYDSFWFRDNVNRGGNALVRFTAPLPDRRERMVNLASVELAEVAAVRRLPEVTEVTSAAGTAPAAWYDPNRVLHFKHPGYADFTEAALHDHSMLETYPLTWSVGNLALGSVLAQHQYLAEGAQRARAAASFASIGSGQPACTIFVFTRRAFGSGYHVLLSMGDATLGNGMGMAIDDGFYMPWLGGNDSWTSVDYDNASDNWRSFAYSWPASSNTVSAYVNAALIGTQAHARTYQPGPLNLWTNTAGADSDALSRFGQILIFPAALTIAQVKAVHNLFCAQYGVATVA